MSRTVLACWIAPATLFWSWHLACGYGIGGHLLSDEFHDLALFVIGFVSGVEPGRVPWLVLEATAVDGLILTALVAWRRRKSLGAAISRILGNYGSRASSSADSLSSAP